MDSFGFLKTFPTYKPTFCWLLAPWVLLVDSPVALKGQGFGKHVVKDVAVYC